MLFLTLLARQIEQRLFRRRAERLLAEVQSLELPKTPCQEARAKFQHWGAKRKFDSPCDEHKCSLEITLYENVAGWIFDRNVFVKLDDYFRWKLKLTYDMGPFQRAMHYFFHAYLRVGGHPARVVADVGMRDGVVWSIRFHVWIETYGHPIYRSGNDRFESTLIASAFTVSRFDGHFGGLIDPQLMLHPYYSIGRPSGCTICVAGWTIFTPYAAPADVRRLMQLDLSCLTRWGQCLTQSDIMPIPWAQYLGEHPFVDASSGEPACSPSFLEILGRDSANIAEAEILKYEDKADSQGYHLGVARARLLKRLKGVADWNVGEIREVPVWGGNGRDELKLHIGAQLVLFRRKGHSSGEWTASWSACPITWVNEPNLSLIRRGIDEDYSALDPSQ